MSNPVKQFYELGPFRIDVANRLLLRDGEPLTPKAVDTLIALVQHSGQALNKEELMKLVTLKMDPDDPQAFAARRLLGWISLHRGLPDQALEEFIKALRLQRADSDWPSTLRQAYAATGMQGYWRKWLELQQSRIQRGRLNPFYLAQIHAFLGETEQAFAYLGKAYEDRSVRPAVLQFNPNFDCLRADPKYEALRRRLALTPSAESGK